MSREGAEGETRGEPESTLVGFGSRRRSAPRSAVRAAIAATGGLRVADSLEGLVVDVYRNASDGFWLLPRDPGSHRAALALYSPQRIRGRLFRIAMSRGRLAAGRLCLDAGPVEDLRVQLERTLGDRIRTLAFYVGPPNIDRLCTACAISGSGRIAGFAKIAHLDPARAKVSREREVLAALAGARELAGRIPTVAGSFRWAAAEVVVLTPGPSRSAPQRFGTLHREFLDRLHAVTGRRGDLLDSPAWAEAAKSRDRLVALLPSEWVDRYGRAFEQVRSRLEGSVIPLVRAHRDFVPWNIRRGENGLFVFDWESSRDGLPAPYDMFQHAVLPAALMDRSLSILHETRRVFGRSRSRGVPGTEELLLPFLVDLSLDYAAAAVSHPYRGKERVRDWFGRAIDRALDRH